MNSRLTSAAKPELLKRFAAFHQNAQLNESHKICFIDTSEVQASRYQLCASSWNETVEFCGE